MQLLSLAIHDAAVHAAVFEAAATAEPLGPVARVPFDVRRPTPEAAEVAPEDLWSALTAAARTACRDFPSVMGIGLAARAPWLVLLDNADRPLGPFWTHLDHRARQAARQTEAAVGDELLASAGNRPVAANMTAVHYRQQLSDDPYMSHRVASFLQVSGWLALRLTGTRAYDPAGACLTGLFGTLTDRCWSSKWCDFFEVDRAWLPPVVCGSTTLGTVRTAVAAELGVPAGIPLKLGTTGVGSAMLAARMTAGDLLHAVGPRQSLTTLASRPQPSPRLLTHLLGVGDDLVQTACNPVGGDALEWIRQLCFQDQSEVAFYERTLPAALERTPRELLDPPHLAGDPLAIEAQRAAFRDLTLATDRLHLLAAVVQALRRGHRQAMDALGPGRDWQRVVQTGARAALVRRLLPDTGTASVETLDNASLKGAAMLFNRSAA